MRLKKTFRLVGANHRVARKLPFSLATDDGIVGIKIDNISVVKITENGFACNSLRVSSFSNCFFEDI